MKDFKSSRFSRLSQLSLGIAKATTQYASSVIVNKANEIIERKAEIDELAHKAKAAKELVQTMSSMKGGLMKLGQMLSITDDLILPREIADIFKSLQKSAPSMSEEDLNRVFQRNFNKKPEEVFKQFDRTPFAAASIGQVHLAYTHSGEKVAVKVQYPKIVDAIKNDMQNIHQLDRLLGIFIKDKPQIDSMLNELKTSLLNECDYKLELANMELFRHILSEEFKDKIIIPKTYKDFSTHEILTTEFVTGDSFEETLMYDQEKRDELGKILYNSFLYCFFEKMVLHTDPQAGNYLFRPNQIILLDFGSTRQFSQDFVESYALLCLACAQDDWDLFKYSIVALGIQQENDPEDQFNHAHELVNSIYQPFLKEGAYPINDTNPLKLIKQYIQSINLQGRKAAREEFLLLDRANLGIFTKLKLWQSNVNWKEGRLTYQKSRELKSLESYRQRSKNSV